MKRLFSILAVIAVVTFTSCQYVNKNKSKEAVINGGEEVVRKDGCHYVVIYANDGQVAAVFHSGTCPNHKK